MSCQKVVLRSVRLYLLIVVSFILLSGGANPGGVAYADDRKVEIRTAAVYYLVKFSRWPAGSYGEDIVVCAVSDDDAFRALRTHFQDKKKGETPISIKRIADLARDNLNLCNLLYVDFLNGEDLSSPKLLTKVSGRPVLTVGRSQAFIDAGGMVVLKEENNRLRIYVNLSAVRQVGLELSSELLAIATVLDKS